MSDFATTVRPDQQYHAHHSHRSLYIKIFLALMVRLVLTMVAALFNLGELNLIVAMTIAVAKALLIVLFFMHFKDSDTLTWLVGGGTLNVTCWLGLMMAWASIL